jgi:hypothetical protein
VINAIADALAELGVEHVELPATPERVWRAIRAVRGADGLVRGANAPLTHLRPLTLPRPARGSPR